MSMPSSTVKSRADMFDRGLIGLQPQLSNLRLIKYFGMEPALCSFGNPGALTGCRRRFPQPRTASSRESQAHIEVSKESHNA